MDKWCYLTIFVENFSVMAIEIERKFLVSEKALTDKMSEGEEIIQGYLSDNPDSTVRVRIKGEKAYLTVKSRNNGSVRGEWEYEIPVCDARQMLDQCGVTGLISKTRYRSGRWEIDEFHGRLEGLLMAEVELYSEDEKISLPSFLGREVTGDSRYYNSVLAKIDPSDIEFE